MSNNERPIVSIIIPCYNVEMYVEKCIRSIMEQEYRDIEIIPVDDGSPDNTPIILDKLASEDPRIHVIHKQNAGVSAARNSGLDLARGKYIVFVDGDDYIAKDYVDYMLNLATKDDADFVLSKNWYMQDGQNQLSTDNIETITPAQATALLLSPRIMVGCWNKMYKKSFLDQHKLRFSTSLFYGEGLFFITKVAQLAKRIVVGERMVYYYRKNNEASATTKYDIAKYRNGEVSIDRIGKELIIKDADVDLMFSLHKSLFCMTALSHTYAQHLNNEYKSDCKHWKSVIRENLLKLLFSNKVPFYRRILLLGGTVSPRLYSKLNMWKRRHLANKSIE